MASLINELIDVLKNEYTIYQQLIPIANEKTQVIVKNDIIALQEITNREQDAVDQIHLMEKKREEILVNIGTVINRKPEALNFSILIQIMENQPKEQKEISELHDNLKAMIHNLVEINNRNKLLIQQSLEMIEFNMNFIQSTRMSPGNNTYTKGAAEYGAPAFGTGMFDAKQ